MRLLTKIWLSTSVAITALFAATGWIVSQHLVTEIMKQLTAEVATSLQAYRSLWRERAQMLETLSAQIASSPQVRAAFGTGDAATIADTSGDLLRNLERQLGERGLVVVTDPQGRVIARLAAYQGVAAPGRLDFVNDARSKFPAQQSGFDVIEDHLYQFVVTPVYVQSGGGLALIDVLVTGFEVTDAVARELRLSTGSDFVFRSDGKTFASTLGPARARLLPLVGGRPAGQAQPISAAGLHYIELSEPLLNVEGEPAGSLSVLRSLEAAAAAASALRRQIAAIWVVSLVLSFVITYILARRIIQPIEALDYAAAQVARENYDYRVEAVSNDEIGRLAQTFNHMCASIRQARQELIRNERLYTIGRLASSIVHDLRNPLAAIYGGSEMLLHADLPAPQQKRLSANLYKASQRIQQLLDDLLNVGRGNTGGAREERPLGEILQGAVEPLRNAAEAQKVEIHVSGAEDLVVAADRSRLERAFSNLLVNALEVMPGGGRISIDCRADGENIVIRVADTGPGIPAEIRDRLFQPFASAGKKNGTGLGLALARQTVLDHGGKMWADSGAGPGAAFFIVLPLARPGARFSANLEGQRVV
ncbi:MAG TPA: ATP-binding protein [Bryobacterales bacterium]|jgi:signal transduction histidine kinase|nr:ATP-binding protein [Bryobacterales bacterium]